MDSYNKPLVILKFAVSLNGFIDKGENKRTIISNDIDKQAVDKLRSFSDAILIGGDTARNDNPELVLKNQKYSLERANKGMSSNPARIIIWGSGHSFNKYSDLKVFNCSKSETIIFIHKKLKEEAETVIPHLSKIYYESDLIALDEIIRNLNSRNINKILVEGGGKLGAQFIEQEKADIIRLAYSTSIFNSKFAKKISITENKVLNNASLYFQEEGEVLASWYALNTKGVKFINSFLID